MRLWTVHPKYLDSKGLVAAWREALLAQKVLAGLTTGYRAHPQLIRFSSSPEPTAVVATFLAGIAVEAERRGYCFDVSKIPARRFSGQLLETDGQLFSEWRHLQDKLRHRAPQIYQRYRKIKLPEAHSLFRIVPGKVQQWERA